MIALPDDYVVNKLYENVHLLTYNKFNDTYNGCCPFCREGKSWGKKKRFFYIPGKELAYCHNCGYSKRPFNFVCDLIEKPPLEIITEVKSFSSDNKIQVKDKSSESEVKTAETLPKDSINLLDKKQILFYKDNKVIKQAIKFLNKRNLVKAINKPDAYYISLTDSIHKNRLIIPFYDQDSSIIFYQSRKLLDTDYKAKYISKMYGERSFCGINNLDPLGEYVFIFEGPIDSFFIKNGVAMGGITESGNLFTKIQQRQMNFLKYYKIIFVLDNQWIDETALKKSFQLLNEGYKIFIWPKDLKEFKDFNDIVLHKKTAQIDEQFVIENTYSDLKGKLLLTEIKNKN